MEIWKKMWVGVFSEHSVQYCNINNPGDLNDDLWLINDNCWRFMVPWSCFMFDSPYTISHWVHWNQASICNGFLGRLHPVKANFPRLSTPTSSVERVTAFKILGINFEANLSIQLLLKASKRLYFLKQLKRAGVPTDQLLHFYSVSQKIPLRFSEFFPKRLGIFKSIFNTHIILSFLQ